MTTFQKIIKYAAFAFAWFLVITCISTCFVGLYYFGALLGFDVSSESKDLKEIILPTTHVKNIKIELGSSSFTIKEGNSFKLESTSSKISAKEKDGYIIIEEKFSWFTTNEKQVVLTLPENDILGCFEIETGAGLLEIESLKVNELDLDLGAGKVKVNNLEVYRRADIDGGAGEIEIHSNKMNNINLNMGVGKLKLNASIFGKSKIEAGIGEMLVNILETEELYTLKLEKGIGTIKVNNQEIDTNTTLGTGTNVLDIEGGIGSIKINFKGN